jgi:hypothetical protein
MIGHGSFYFRHARRDSQFRATVYAYAVGVEVQQRVGMIGGWGRVGMDSTDGDAARLGHIIVPNRTTQLRHSPPMATLNCNRLQISDLRTRKTSRTNGNRYCIAYSDGKENFFTADLSHGRINRARKCCELGHFAVHTRGSLAF